MRDLYRSALFILIILCITWTMPVTARAEDEKVVIDNKNHFISYKIEKQNVIFILEAVNDFTDEMVGKFPKSDFFAIDVDVNQNGKIDKNIDVSYAIISNRIGICTNYLIDYEASTTCGEFKSKAYLEISFRGTNREPKEHPVFKFTIPRNELNVTGDSAHVVFLCHSAKKGYTWYPNSNDKNFHSFSKVITIQL